MPAEPLLTQGLLPEPMCSGRSTSVHQNNILYQLPSMDLPMTTPSISWTNDIYETATMNAATLNIIDEVCSIGEINTPDIQDIDSLTFPSVTDAYSDSHFESSFQLSNIEFDAPSDLLVGIDPLLSSPVNMDYSAGQESDGTSYMYIDPYQPPTQINDDTDCIFDELMYEETNINWDMPHTSISDDLNPNLPADNILDDNILSKAVEIIGLDIYKEEMVNTFLNTDASIKHECPQALDDIHMYFDQSISSSSTKIDECSSWEGTREISSPEPSSFFIDSCSESLFSNFDKADITPERKRTRKTPRRYHDGVDPDNNDVGFSPSNVQDTKRNKLCLKGLSEAEKYRRIREQNNAASKKCRVKRKEVLSSQSQELENLQAANKKLREKYDRTRLALQNIKKEWAKRVALNAG